MKCKKWFSAFVAVAVPLLISIGISYAQLSDGLIAYYPFNGNADDASGNGYHGIVNGAIPTSDRLGNVNSAYYLNGLDNYIQCPVPNASQLNNFTVAFWLKYEWQPHRIWIIHFGFDDLVATYEGENRGFHSLITVIGEWGFQQGYTQAGFFSGSQNSFNLTSLQGQWIHLVTVYNASANVLKSYINGALIDTDNISFNSPSLQDYPLFIGKISPLWPTDSYFKGDIDEVRIYNRALSDLEVQELSQLGGPFPEFTFAHISDVHIGAEITAGLLRHFSDALSPFYLAPYTESLLQITKLNPRPDFILITGDNVEWANWQYLSWFKTFTNTLSTTKNIPIYYVPGNHDRYDRPPLKIPISDHLEQYYNIIGRPDEFNTNITIFPGFEGYSSSNNSTDSGLNWYNYSFSHKGYLFIGLDSGADHHLDLSPEGEGLHNDQMTVLNGFEQTKPKIIFMHHPIYPEIMDGEYVNESITSNRTEFINYCSSHNVRLVLSGHTHTDHQYPINPIGEETMFIQTHSATKDAYSYPQSYRIVSVKNENTVTLQPYPSPTPIKFPILYDKKYIKYALGPVHLGVYDSQGRFTGTGSIIVDIPDSYYTGYTDPSTPQLLILYDLSENYRFEVTGVDLGVADVGLLGNNMIIQLQDLPVTATTVDKMHFQEDSAFVYSTSDQEKDFSVSLAREFEDQSRIFLVSNTSISNTDSVKLKIVENQSLHFTNIGSPKTYDVHLFQTGVDSGEFAFPNIALGENETQIISPTSWQYLETQPIHIYTDAGMDGTIDDTLTVQNRAASMTSYFAQTGWNMISSFVIPTDPKLAKMLNLISNNIVLLKNGKGQFYWPAYNIDQINDWKIEDGYQIYISGPDTLLVNGYSVIPESTPLSLSAGWNMISYLRNNPMPTETALASISGNIVIVKNGAGQVYWPAPGINTIGSMQPGQGYQIYVNAAAILTFPANEVIPKPSAFIAHQTSMPVHYTAYRTNTGNNAILLISTPGLPDGSEVGVWTVNHLLIGSGVIHEGKALLTLWGDDTMTQQVDGAVSAEPLELTSWCPNQDAEIPLHLPAVKDGLTQAILSATLEYQSNAVWLAETEGGTKVPTEFDLKQNYPNPFNPNTTIKYQLPRETKVEITIYNLSGAIVRTLVNGLKPAGYHDVVWNGRDDRDRLVTSGIYWVKMKAGDYQKTFKMSLIK